MRWAKRFEKRRWAVEGASGTGHLLAQHLVASGEGVVDAPVNLSARIRVLSVGNERKREILRCLRWYVAGEVYCVLVPAVAASPPIAAYPGIPLRWSAIMF